MPLSFFAKEPSTRCALISWGLLGLLLFWMNVCVPMVWDDWCYREESWADILPATYHEYFVHNPRIASTLLTRCFSLMPPLLVDVLNTAAFLLLAALSLYLAFGKAWKRWASRWQSVILFWVLTVGIVPVFGEVFLWHCGSASYLWVHLCALGMLALFRPLWEENAANNPGSSTTVKLSLRLLPLLALMALVAGCSNFHTGPAILFSCVLMTWLGRNRIRPLWGMYLLLALCAISCLLMLIAPGNDGRMLTVASGEDFKEVSCLNMLGRLLEPHARALPLYILLFFAIRWRRKRGHWCQTDTHITAGALGIAVLTQAAFLFSPVTPPARSWQITFALIIVASLRVLLPIMILYRPRPTFRFFLLFLAALPLLGTPKMIAEREWMHQAMRTMADQSGREQDVELPYWPFTKDKLFGFMREYVSSENPEGWQNTAVARCYDLKSVRQSPLRCTYSGPLNGWQAEAASYDAPHYATLTRWTLVPGANIRQTGNMFLCIAHPDERKKYWEPAALLHRLFASGEDTTLTRQELEDRGYRVEVLPLPDLGQDGHFPIDWERGKKFSKKPESPVLWAAVLSSPPEQDTPFTRLEPDRKGL